MFNSKPNLLTELATDSLESQAKDFTKLLTAISFWSMGELDCDNLGKDVAAWNTRLSTFYATVKFTKPVTGQLLALTTAIDNKTRANAKHEELMVELGQYLAITDKRFEALTEISADTLRYIRQNAVYLRTGSQTAYKFLFKNATKIYQGFGQKAIDNALPSQLADAHKLISTIENLTGRRDIKLTPDESEKFKISHPEEHATILSTRKNIVDVAKQFIRMHVRKRGGMIKYSELLDDCEKNYIYHDFPDSDGWDGYIDEEGTLYTLDKKKIKGKPGFKIVGNPEYVAKTDNTFVFSCTTARDNKQYFYTEAAAKGWKEERFEAVDDFAPMIQKVRNEWLSDLKNKAKVQKLAVICELLYWASARIGGESTNLKGEKRFGISTLLGKHVQKDGSNLVIDYVGKHGINQHHILTPKTADQKTVAKLVLAWSKEAGEEGRVFDLLGKGLTYPGNGVVNNYFRAKGAPSNVSIHKLRHARATVIMGEQLKTCPFFKNLAGERVPNLSKKPDQKEAEAWYLEAATKVGAELGHSAGGKVSGTTAIQAYVNPTTTVSFFEELKLRLPSYAKKFVSDDD